MTYRRPPASGLTPAAGPEHGGRQEETASPRRKRRRRGLWIFLACFAGIVLLAGVSLLLEGRSTEIREDPFEQYYDEEPIHETSGEITIPTWPSGQGGSLTLRLDHGAVLTAQEVYQAVNPAVVMVMAQLEDGVSVGTGVIFSSDGYILTNYHVLEGGSECVVVLDTGIQYTARYVGGDQDNDLAVLKVDAEGLPTAEFGDSDLLTVGDTVYAIGNPLGVELRGTLTDGLVSAIDRDVVVDGRVMTLIQTNAALNSGNSGGPLINQYGQVVGINVIKMTSEYSNVEGLGFAIPSTSVERITNDILTWGEAQPEPLLGVTVYQEGAQLGTDLWGLEVIDVTRGSAAASPPAGRNCGPAGTCCGSAATVTWVMNCPWSSGGTESAWKWCWSCRRACVKRKTSMPRRAWMFFCAFATQGSGGRRCCSGSGSGCPRSLAEKGGRETHHVRFLLSGQSRETPESSR